jgi:hypothetical protein
VHYPGDGNVLYIRLSRAQVAEKLRGYWRYHVLTRKWSDIGYQVAIDQAGRVWDLRGIDRIPAASASDANPDANKEWGACLMVIGNSETPTPAMIEAFRHWRHFRWLARWPGRLQVRGHRQVPGASTSCPGSRLVALIDSGSLSRAPAIPPPTGDDDMSVADARIALATMFDEAANGSTPTGRNLRKDLAAIFAPIIADVLDDPDAAATAALAIVDGSEALEELLVRDREPNPELGIDHVTGERVDPGPTDGAAYDVGARDDVAQGDDVADPSER